MFFFRAPQNRGEALWNVQYAHVKRAPLKPTIYLRMIETHLSL